ncbi:unnamed protein product, partial [Ilex paraguariensis]
MFKYKHQSFFIANINNKKLGFFSASCATSMVEPIILPRLHQETFSNHNTHVAETLKFQFSRTFDPKYYLSTLQNCVTLSHIRQVHAQVAANGMLRDLIVSNKLLYVYTQHRHLTDAYALFDGMSERDPFFWSVMVGGFSKIDDYRICFRTFREYIRSGQRPDNFTLPFVIRACRDTMDLQMGRLIHDIVYKLGLHSDRFVSAALVDMYAKCKVIDDAKQLFDKMLNRDLVTWTVMIGGYSECGNANTALGLFDRMRNEGVVPDKVAMVNVVNACAKWGAMHKATFVHDYIWRNNFSLDVILGTAMID